MHARALTVVAMVVWLSACAGPATDRHLTELFHSSRLAMRRGELDQARTLAARGVELSRARADSDLSWQLQLLHCEILLNQLALAEASTCLTAPIPDDPRFDELRAQQHYLRAKAHVGDGKLHEALASLDIAHQSARPGGEVWLDAEILGGQIRLRLGQWEEAEDRLTAVVSRASNADDRHRRALALNNLGMGRLIRGRYDEAVVRFEQVLSDSTLEEMAVYGSALNNAGICYARLGQFEAAVAAQQRAVRIYERRGASRQLVEFLGSLGNTHVLSGNPKAAVPFLRRAMEAAAAANLQGDAALWAGNLATAHGELGEWADAERFNDHATRLSTANPSIKRVYFTLNAASIAAGRGDARTAQRLYEDALIRAEGTPAVLWSAHAGLGRAAWSAGRPDAAARHFEAALSTIEKTRSNLLKTEFRLSFLTQLIEFYQMYVDLLVSQSRFERALEIAESSRARVLAERHGVQAADRISTTSLRTLAQQSGTALLSYWLAPEGSSLWLVDASGVHYHRLPAAKEIESLVRQHQAMIHNALADPLVGTDTPGDRLYRMLIAPVSKRLSPGASVVIVPDGALYRLNFETLPVRANGRHYWIEDAEIQIAPSLPVLSVGASAPVSRSLLLIGDATAREPEFPALRYASSEMANVSRHFPPQSVTAHQRERAAPGAYRNAQLDRFGLIHFTAHAVANADSPLDSAIMLSGPDDGFKLYARDVADRPLNADLVTVSACRSAGERTYSGEGLVGFAWAFLRAGARRVIAGLWDVDDRSTADLMDAVYARIAAGATPPRALREAKLAALRKGGTSAKPYYWGPFEVFTAVLETPQPRSGTRSSTVQLRSPEAKGRTVPEL